MCRKMLTHHSLFDPVVDGALVGSGGTGKEKTKFNFFIRFITNFEARHIIIKVHFLISFNKLRNAKKYARSIKKVKTSQLKINSTF